MRKYFVTILAVVSLSSSVCLASTDYNAGLVETTAVSTSAVDVPGPIGASATIMPTDPQIRSVAVPNDRNKATIVLQPTATEKQQLDPGRKVPVVALSTTPKSDQLDSVLSSPSRLNEQLTPNTIQGTPVTSSVKTESNAVATMPSGLVNMSTYGLIGYGTGFFVTPDIIATNWHVVQDVDNISIVHLGVSTKATLIAKDENNDLALLKINSFAISSKAKVLPIIDMRKVNVGERVYTVGFPDPIKLGFRPKITDGLINSVAGEEDNPNCFQISTPIQPGNSGSPLLNSHGQVVGVISKRWTTKQYQNVSYAVKSNHLVNLLLSLPEGITISEDPVFANSVEGADIMLLARDAVVTIVRSRTD